MNKATSVVEINGNRYDAVTGQLVGAARKAAHQIKKPIANLTIDGFTKPSKSIKKSAARRSMYSSQRQNLSRSWQRQPEQSKTLMRSIVRKPAKPEPEAKIKTRSLSPNYARAGRAREAIRNSKVQRFGVLRSSYTKAGEVIQKKRGAAKFGEARYRLAPGSLRHHDITGSAAASTTLPAIRSTASHHRLERLLDYALTQADAHKKVLDKNLRGRRKLFGRLPRWLGICLLITLLGGAIGLIIWQKVPQASMKLASAKAGVNASLPTPISGYKIGPISYSEHAVTTIIQSTSDSSKKYTVTEKPSSQPTASLAATVTASSGNQVQTVQDKDKTYVLSQEDNKSKAACTKGTNTISVESLGLNTAQLLEAAKNACD